MHIEKPTKAALAEFGAVGSRIPGSKYVRAYCTFCGEPMRVNYVEFMPRCVDHPLTREEELEVLEMRAEAEAKEIRHDCG